MCIRDSDPAGFGRARDEMLFGYESVAAGTVWLFSIEIDGDVPEEIDGALTAALTGRELAIGRSRGAGYGRVRVEPWGAVPALAVAPAEAGLRRVAVYAASDLALLDPERRQPTLAPRPEHFGLPSGALDRAHSFLRTRRYSPFHGVRRDHGLERQLLQRGSVLVFRLDEPMTEDELARARRFQASGIGLYRAEGFGRVVTEPLLLAADQPFRVPPPGESGLPPAPAHPLYRWLEGRNRAAGLRPEAERLAVVWEERFRRAPARQGPTRSQWGRVRELLSLIHISEPTRPY